MYQSIATIDSPQFINLKPLEINPLMSACEIKVLYVGKNRNRSVIDKEAATKMAKTLRGAPIVGYWKEDKQDYGGHDSRITIDDEGIKFTCLTVPYGFVSPTARVWFQNFEETDELGNVTIREYLMTEGYLWTGQFEECAAVINEGRGQSMELSEKDVQGHWETDKGIDFYIINDATFSKLCILGNDVEPCFEGANITAPKVSLSFTKVDDGFKRTLFTMMQDLQTALQGEQRMENNNLEQEAVPTSSEPVAEVVTEPEVVAEEAAPAAEVETPAEPAVEAAEVPEEIPAEPVQEPAVEEVGGEEEAVAAEGSDTPAPAEDFEAKYNELEQKYSAYMAEQEELVSKLYSTISSLEAQNQDLLAFRRSVENSQKDAMIESFSFLSDEDKKDVVEHKEQYSLDEIESKLSVIAVRQKVNFGLENKDKNNISMTGPAMTYNLDNYAAESVPAWIRAVKNNKNN